METRELLNKLKGQEVALEIQYVNSAGISNKHIIDCSDLKTSKRRTTFDAFAFNIGTELTFAIDNVKGIKVLTLENTPSLTFGKGYRQWTYVFSEDLRCEKDGIYMIVCRGDNHLVFELYKMEKNTRFGDYYSGENTHFSGWFRVEPLAFHCIPPYPVSLKEDMDSVGWETFDFGHNTPEEYLAPHSGIYVRAFWIEDSELPNSGNSGALFGEDTFYSWAYLACGFNYDYVICRRGYGLLDDYIPAYSDYYDFTVKYQNKTLYKKYIGYICFVEFTEDNHSIYWDLYEDLKNASEQKYGEFNNEK